MSNPRKARGLYKRWMNDKYDDTNIPRTTKWRRQNFDSSENITSDRLSIYSEDSSPTETFGNGSNLHGINNGLIDSTDEECTIQTSFSDQSEEIHETHDHLQTEVDMSEKLDVAGGGNDFDLFEERNNNGDEVDLDDSVSENCDYSQPAQVCTSAIVCNFNWLKF